MGLADILLHSGAFLALIALLVSGKSRVKKDLDSRKQIQALVVPTNQIQNKRLSITITLESMSGLMAFATKILPDVIVGLNRGGTLIGAFIALGLRIPNERFVPFFVNTKEGIVEGDFNRIKGVVLVVDDICRSGRTFEKAVDIIKDLNVSSKIYSASMVAEIDDLLHPNYKNLDFCTYGVEEKDLLLPWTDPMSRTGNQDIIEKQKLQFEEKRKQPIENLADEVSQTIQKGTI